LVASKNLQRLMESVKHGDALAHGRSGLDDIIDLVDTLFLVGKEIPGKLRLFSEDAKGNSLAVRRLARQFDYEIHHVAYSLVVGAVRFQQNQNPVIEVRGAAENRENGLAHLGLEIFRMQIGQVVAALLVERCGERVGGAVLSCGPRWKNENRKPKNETHNNETHSEVT